jgi:hypothetical protein
MPKTCFDPDDFMVSAHDSEGHTARLTLDLHPGQYRMLEYLVNTNRNGFHTKDAVLRWCVCWGIHTLLGPLPNTMALMEAKMDIFYDERFQEQKDCLGISVHKYLAAENLEAARRTVTLCHDDYSRIACEYWRERWLSTLKESIDLLQRRGVRITPREKNGMAGL